MLSPITKIFPGTLVSPSSTKYAWIGADEAEIIFFKMTIGIIMGKLNGMIC